MCYDSDNKIIRMTKMHAFSQSYSCSAHHTIIDMFFHCIAQCNDSIIGKPAYKPLTTESSSALTVLNAGQERHRAVTISTPKNSLPEQVEEKN